RAMLVRRTVARNALGAPEGVAEQTHSVRAVDVHAEVKRRACGRTRVKNCSAALFDSREQQLEDVAATGRAIGAGVHSSGDVSERHDHDYPAGFGRSIRNPCYPAESLLSTNKCSCRIISSISSTRSAARSE